MNIQGLLEKIYFEFKTLMATQGPMFKLALVLLAIAIMVLLYVVIKIIRGVKKERVATPKTLTRPGKYEFNICDIGDSHKWVRVRKDEMSFTHSEDERSYKIETQNLYEIQPGLLLKLKWKLKGITTGFMIVFSGDKPQAVSYEDPKRSAYVLKSVEESRALSNALKDEFKKALDVKNVFIYIVIGVVILVVYLALTGQLRM